MPFNPITPGKTKDIKLYGDAAAGPPLEKLKAGGSLSDLKKEFELFTYAPFLLYSGLQHNPIQEWINKYNHNRVVFIVPLEKQLFKTSLLRNSPNKFDLILWAVYKEHWTSLAGHLGSTGLINKQNKVYTRVLSQEIPISYILDNTTIYTFSVDSNKVCIPFAVPGYPGIPYLQVREPLEDTVKLAEILLNENPNYAS